MPDDEAETPDTKLLRELYAASKGARALGHYTLEDLLVRAYNRIAEDRLHKATAEVVRRFRDVLSAPVKVTHGKRTR